MRLNSATTPWWRNLPWKSPVRESDGFEDLVLAIGGEGQRLAEGTQREPSARPRTHARQEQGDLLRTPFLV